MIIVEFTKHLGEEGTTVRRAVIGGRSVSLMMTVIMVPAAYYVAYRKDDRQQPQGAA
jgi:hypothetical protein